MVFVLRHVLNGTILILGPNATYSLGKSRRNCIQLCDVTVDNTHATLEISDGHADIVDNGTNFGTWVNKQKISEPFRLRNGDVIVFGIKQCKYVFLEPKYEALVDCSVSKSTKSKLAETLRELDIRLAKKFSRTSTHYITESVSLDMLKEKTILYYLIDRKTVITPKYFIDILTNIEEAPVIPNIYRYMPEVDNYLKRRGIEDINPRKNRRHIFEYTAFIFFDQKCDDDLCDLIIKCGGEAIVCSQKRSFYHELLENMNRCQYVAVNHNKNNRKSTQMYTFLKTMRKKRKKVIEINAEDVYVSVLKGELVGAKEPSLQASLEEPRPGTSKSPDCIVLNCSEDETSGPESEPVDIVCKIINDKGSNGKNDISDNMASPDKQHKTLKVILQNNERSPTLNKWVHRKKTDDKELNHKKFENGVMCSSTINNETKECNKDQPTDASSNKEVDYDRLLQELEEIFGTSEDTVEKCVSSTSPITKKKRVDDNVQDTMQSGDTESAKANFERVNNSKINGKRNSIVINPFAIKESPKKIKEEGNNGAPLEKLWKRYKHVDIIPMT